MITFSKNLTLSLAFLAGALTASGLSAAEAPRKVTLLKGARAVTDEPARRFYFSSFSEDEGKIMALLERLSGAGARSINVFLPGLLVCEVPSGVNPWAIAGDPDITVASEEQVDHESPAAPVFSREWAKRWYLEAEALAGRGEYEARLERAGGVDPAKMGVGVHRVPQEVINRDARRVEALGVSAQDERLIFQNSEILAGTILIQLVFPESEGSNEDWTDGEIGTAAGGVAMAASFYQTECRRTDVTFVTRRVERVDTYTEPIDFEIERDSVWVADVMSNLGYPGRPASYLQLVHAYNNHYREVYGADWALTIFAVRAVNDPDHSFLRARKASYAYLGGPFCAVAYPVVSPSAYWFGQAVKLCMSYVFWALDENINSRDPCSAESGYLNYRNSNRIDRIDPIYGTRLTCFLGPHENCVACAQDVLDYGYDGPPCRFTEGQLGYVDRIPLDGVPDAFGIGPDIDFGAAEVETVLTQGSNVYFEVHSIPVQNVNSQQPSALRRNYAAAIMDVNYTVGGVGPISLQPVDGVFDEIDEEFDSALPALLPGYSDIEVVARNTYGARSEETKRVFYLGLDYYGFSFNHRSEGVGLGWSMRGETFNAEFDLHRIDHDIGGVDTAVAADLNPLGPTSQGGFTKYYHMDDSVTPGGNYSYYVCGRFEVMYRGEPTAFVTLSDTFRTVAAFPREGTIVSAPSPNPFNPSVDGQVRISVSVPDAPGILNPQTSSGPQLTTTEDEPSPVPVTIRVYDVAGRLVKNLYYERVFVTVVTRSWDGTNQNGDQVPTGMYFIKATAGTKTGARKVLVVR